MVEEAFGLGVYDGLPGLPALGLNEVAEVKRLVRDQDLHGIAGLRVALETIMALIAASSFAWDLPVKAWLGDIEPRVARLASFLHLRVHMVNARPRPAATSTDARYLSHHFAAGQARPFVIWTAELGPTAPRCAQVQAALALPDPAAAPALAAASAHRKGSPR